MNNKTNIVFAGLLIVTMLSACAIANGATPFASTGSNSGAPSSGQLAQNPQLQTRIASNPQLATRVAVGGFTGGFNRTRGSSTPAPTETPVPTDTPQPTATPVDQTAGAVQAAQDYFTALQTSDFPTAANLVSAFTKMTFNMTSDDVVLALTQLMQQGAQYAGFQVKDSQAFNDQTILVHVTYTLTTTDPKTRKDTQAAKDELWPFRLEARQWRYNWNNLIDYKTLSYTTQATAGLAVTPLQISRYSDHLSLTVLAQNGTHDAIVIGQTNQILATFHFGDKALQATNTRFVFDSLRSYDDVEIVLPGLYTTYPDSVELVKYKNYNQAPWFTFSLVD